MEQTLRAVVEVYLPTFSSVNELVNKLWFTLHYVVFASLFTLSADLKQEEGAENETIKHFKIPCWQRVMDDDGKLISNV